MGAWWLVAGCWLPVGVIFRLGRRRVLCALINVSHSFSMCCMQWTNRRRDVVSNHEPWIGGGGGGIVGHTNDGLALFGAELRRRNGESGTFQEDMDGWKCVYGLGASAMALWHIVWQRGRGRQQWEVDFSTE